ALHTQTQAALLGRNALFGHGATDFRDRLFGDRDAFGRGLRGFGCCGHSLGCSRPFGAFSWSSYLVILPTTCAAGCILSPLCGWSFAGSRHRAIPTHSQFGLAAHGYFASAATGLGVSCFFFQSPIAARMASSASTEQ